jgi:hypothetical protein
MEIQIVAVVAAGILLMLMMLSPAPEHARHPVHMVLGADQHARRMRRATVAAQVVQRQRPEERHATQRTRRHEAESVARTRAGAGAESSRAPRLEVWQHESPVAAPVPVPEWAAVPEPQAQWPKPIRPAQVAVPAQHPTWAWSAPGQPDARGAEGYADSLVAGLLKPALRSS